MRIFWKISGPTKLTTYTPNRFNVKIIEFKSTDKFLDNEQSLKALYTTIKEYSEDAIIISDTPIKSVGRPTVQITIRAQMTTEKTGKLSVSLNDNLPPIVSTPLHRRAVTGTALGISLVTTALNVVFKKVCYNITYI